MKREMGKKKRELRNEGENEKGRQADKKKGREKVREKGCMREDRKERKSGEVNKYGR